MNPGSSQDRLDAGPAGASLAVVSDVPASGAWRARWDLILRVLLACGGIAALGLIVVVAGWEHESHLLPWMELASRTVLALYAGCQFGRLAIAPLRRPWLRRRWPELALALLCAAMAVEFRPSLEALRDVFPEVAVAELTFLFIVATQVPVLIHLGLKFLRFQEIFAVRRVSAGGVMIVTFGAMIMVGTLLLKMPRATVDGISWLDALFTSTSAVCVTGLNVVDTEATFTTTGRVILLILIQVGGLGVMTLTTFLAAIFGSLSLRGRVLLQDLLSEDNLGRISRTLPLMFLMTFAFEAVGAWALHAAMAGSGDPRGSGWFPAVFHSVSAFCNAGFSIWSGGLYDPIVRGNTAAQAVIMVLIVAGGLGFPVVYATCGWIGGTVARAAGRRRRRAGLSLHARLAWMTTLVLIVGGALALVLTESGRARTGASSSLWMEALFNSITARTAGFNIGPIESLSPASAFVLVFLMFIGGSPGSTAGGIKTTVFAVALLNARRIILGRGDVELFGRRLAEDTVARALAVVFLAMAWILLASVALALVQPAMFFGDLFFEVVSAVSTVGLTRAVTPELGVAGRLIIILTMFAGRVSVLYFVLAFIRRREPPPYRLPEEQVLVA